MKAHFSLFLILFIFLNSCNTSVKCDCEKDCPGQEPMVVTPENSISSEYLYASYLTQEKNRITKKLKSEDSGQLTDEEKAKLEEALKYSKTYLLELNEKIGGGICPPCPEDGICCSDFSYFRLNDKFDKVKIKNPRQNSGIKVNDQTIIELRDLKTKDVLIDKISFQVLNFEGKLVDLDLNIK